MMSADTPIPNLEKSPSRRGSRDRLIVAVLLLALAVGLVGLARLAREPDVVRIVGHAEGHADRSVLVVRIKGVKP